MRCDVLLNCSQQGNNLKRIINGLKILILFAVSNLFLAFPLSLFAGQFKVVQVYDGDTVIAAENGNEITIRLVGIDAPEISREKHLPGQPFCIKSKEYLSSLVLNKVVDIKFYGKDASGRPLGEIFVENKNINIEMVAAGLAEVYRGKPAQNLKISKYREAQKKAKEAVKGIWVLRNQYFSPWDWREMYD
jgi:endonuclease YncB( thermonuclease family)